MKFLVKTVVLSFLLCAVFASCKTSNSLSDSKVFQKRKYTKGFHVNFRKAKPNNEVKSVTVSAFDELQPQKEITPIPRKGIKPFSTEPKERTLVTASSLPSSEKAEVHQLKVHKTNWVKNITLPFLVSEIFSKVPEDNVEQPMPATAVLSFIFAVIGIFVAGIPLGLVAIILGAIAIGKINKNPGMKGQGLAIAGIVIGAVAIIGALYVISTM